MEVKTIPLCWVVNTAGNVVQILFKNKKGPTQLKIKETKLPKRDLPMEW